MQRKDCLFFFAPPQKYQRPREGRLKKKKGFLFSNDKQSTQLNKLNNPIFAANSECFIIRNVTAHLKNSQAKPKSSGGKKLWKTLTHSNKRKRGNRLSIRSFCHVVTIHFAAWCSFLSKALRNPGFRRAGEKLLVNWCKTDSTATKTIIIFPAWLISIAWNLNIQET